MKIEALEEKYPQLKSEFPEMFIFLFSSDGELNDFGKMAEELYQLRRVSRTAFLPNHSNIAPLDCVAEDKCKASLGGHIFSEGDW